MDKKPGTVSLPQWTPTLYVYPPTWTIGTKVNDWMYEQVDRILWKTLNANYRYMASITTDHKWCFDVRMTDGQLEAFKVRAEALMAFWSKPRNKQRLLRYHILHKLTDYVSENEDICYGGHSHEEWAGLVYQQFIFEFGEEVAQEVLLNAMANDRLEEELYSMCAVFHDWDAVGREIRNVLWEELWHKAVRGAYYLDDDTVLGAVVAFLIGYMQGNNNGYDIWQWGFGLRGEYPNKKKLLDLWEQFVDDHVLAVSRLGSETESRQYRIVHATRATLYPLDENDWYVLPEVLRQIQEPLL